MRASPAFQLSLQRFGVWRGAVATIALLGVAALMTWGVAREPAIDLAWFGVSAATAGAIAWLTLSLSRVSARSLRWDGQQWHLGSNGAAANEAMPGALTVSIDLGPWMLLRFEPAASPRRALPIWIPVQRRGIEAQWHALRCAVHSPRTATDADATGR